MSHLDDQIELCIEAMQANYSIPFDDKQLNDVFIELRGNRIFSTTMCSRCKMSQLFLDVIFPGNEERSNWPSAAKIGLRCDKTLERFDLHVIYMTAEKEITGHLPVNLTNRVFCPFVEPE